MPTLPASPTVLVVPSDVLPTPTLAALATNIPPSPTLAASPTDIPLRTPIRTVTRNPTSTPGPTLTPTARASVTPVPSATALPSNTPYPIGAGNAARGKALFHIYTCDSCHDVTHAFPGGYNAPNLGNIRVEAARILALPAYTGAAKTPAQYIRESILTPNVYIVPGPNYQVKPGQSAMVQDFAKRLSPQDLNDLIAYLLTLNVK